MDEKVTKLYKDYSSGRAYQQSMRIVETVSENVRFYEGKQWAEKTENTLAIPRPVTNYVRLIVRNKKAGILSSNVKLAFTCSKNSEYANKLTRFNDAMEAEMDMQRLREDLVESGIVKGSGFLHYYWDADAVGEIGEYKGGVRAEIIDPLNIYFSNPTETDEQKQKWIIIVSRIDVDAVKSMADKSVNKDDIIPDNRDNNDYDEKEQADGDLVTVYTRYFRKGGEVYYERATKSIMLHKPRALTPSIDSLENDSYRLDEAESSSPDKSEKAMVFEYKARLYPVLAYRYEKREKCIYGLSEVEGIIPNQKIINLMSSMHALAAQNTAWGKYIVSEGALRGQVITNIPGQVLIDYSPGNVAGNGIKQMQGQPISDTALKIADTLAQTTRIVTGASETVAGEVMGANQSGEAIAQLQAQALKPIDDLKETFWRTCERGGKIVEQFYKLYYENKPYSYLEEDEWHEDIFNGAEIQNFEFSVKVEAGAGSKWSEAISANILERLMSAGLIDFSTYIELYPDTAMPFKSTLKQKIAEKQQSETAMLNSQFQQQNIELEKTKKQIQQLIEYMREQQSTVQKAVLLISRFDDMQKQLDAIKIESATKILAQNSALKVMDKKGKEVTRDAKLMAEVLNRRNADRGVIAGKATQYIPTQQGKNAKIPMQEGKNASTGTEV